ncbi:DUF6443 domain-containing protein [uncultured Marixanthomonas sp.]|uniref:DUF6443 domain-containing protein n=1 Tax=uncultured Marixanthomonas sp. TaxID=757245 RepID=UPI0030DA83B2
MKTITYIYYINNQLTLIRNRNDQRVSSLLGTLTLLLTMFLFLSTMAQSPGHNWVKTKTYKIPIVTQSQPSQSAVKNDITYYDGLGRPIQQIAAHQGGTGGDLITHIEYDALGRQEKEFLPYPRSNSSLDFESGVLGSSSTFYGTQNPYSQKKFEESPLNRVLKQAAPGDDWRMDLSEHEVKFNYQTNNSIEVHHFTIAANNSFLPELEYEEKYPANQLYKTIIYDENNENKHTVGSIVEFKDKLGRVVLKRHYTTLTGRDVDPDPTRTLDTYYVYDDYGNLAIVIPPKLSEQIIVGGILNGNADDLLDDLGYQYAYDHRNRLRKKKLPGRQTEFIGYDPLDRPIFQGPVLSPFGDGALGSIRTKYDSFDRVAYTVWVAGWLGGGAIDQMEGSTTSTPLSETQTGTSTINGVKFGYTNNVYPTTGYHVLTVNYYDDYDYWGAPSSIPSNVGDGDIPVYYDKTNEPNGMPTGTWVRILTDENTSDAKTSYTLYDRKSRAVRVRTNYAQGGYTQADTKYNFIGNPIYTLTKHRKESGTPELILRDTYTYDSQMRVATHRHKVNNLSERLLAKNEYDDLGRLEVKKTGGTDVTGGNYFQKVDYTYNVRGWLTGINDLEDLAEQGEPLDLFAFKINYTEVENDINGAVKPLFNGNIAETFWRTSSDNIKRKYGYSYDYTNRLLDAWYQKPDAANPINQSFDEHLTYDSNGNILTLKRNGSQEVTGTPIAIDDLNYDYDDGNRLTSVFDSENNPEGFNDGNLVDGDDFYTYDDFGNLTEDLYKGITDISYNHLNLPVKVAFGTEGVIDYLYTADGLKLKRSVTEGGTLTKSIKYREGFQYTNDTLDFFPTAEGYVKTVRNQLGGGGGGGPTIVTYKYVYNYTDHLGNIRVRYTKDPQTNELAILEENHYYPFGLEHKGYNSDQKKISFLPETSTIALTPVNPFLGSSYKYGFQGQERQDELNLGWESFKYRNYNPAIGRFMNIDPLAEDYSYQSPYNFAENKVIANFELEGLEAVSIHTRAFAPFKSFGGGFSGDGANRRFTTSQNVTSRMKQAVNIDFNQSTPAVSGGTQTSDSTHHPLLGTDTAPSRNALKNVQIGETSTGAKQVSFQSEMEGANPLTPAFATPNIDVDGAFSISSNQETGVLSISANISGDNFPSTESFITDSAGNSVFVGVSALQGNPASSLSGEGGTEMINTDIQINFNSDGVFQNVNYNGQEYNISDYNKMFEDQNPNGN